MPALDEIMRSREDDLQNMVYELAYSAFRNGYSVSLPMRDNPTFCEIAHQMQINAEVLMKKMTEHADKEIERIRIEKER